MEIINDTNLLTTDQASKYLKIPISTLKLWRTKTCKSPNGPKFKKIGKKVFYLLSDIDLFLQENTFTHS